MQQRVIRPFRWNGNVRMPGQIVEMDFTQVGQLRKMGLIGQIAPERAVIMPQQKAVPAEREKAVKPPGETRRGRKPKKQEIVPPEFVEENKENGAETGNASGD